MDHSASSCPTTLSESRQLRLLDKLEVFEIWGHDKRGRKVLRVIGKLFPARFVSAQVLRMYLEERIYPKLEDRPFAVVYVHTAVQRTENCPGISIIRSIYEAIPINVKQKLEVVYFVHPGIQTRLFLATFGRLLFSGGLYSKLKYVNRLEFLWEHVRRKKMWEMPDFVNEHDEELERRNTMMDYGLESDHPRIHFGTASMDSMVPSYSTRCIA